MIQTHCSPFPAFPFRLRPRSQVLPYHSSLPSLLRSTSSTSQPFSKISVFEDRFSLHTMLCGLLPAGSTTLEFVFSLFSSSSYFLLVEYLSRTAFGVAYKIPVSGFCQSQATEARFTLSFSVCFSTVRRPRKPAEPQLSSDLRSSVLVLVFLVAFAFAVAFAITFAIASCNRHHLSLSLSFIATAFATSRQRLKTFASFGVNTPAFSLLPFIALCVLVSSGTRPLFSSTTSNFLAQSTRLSSSKRFDTSLGHAARTPRGRLSRISTSATKYSPTCT